MKQKTGVLLINLGTPDSPKTKDVRRYLSEFLNDPRVIDIHPWLRFFLVNCIIVPFRAAKSARIYNILWKKNGGISPLLKYSQIQQEKLQKRVDEHFTIEMAMRYQHPSLEKTLEKMRLAHYEKIIILPLFPQYASASSGSAIEKALKIIQKWWVIPNIQVISDFYTHPLYIQAIVERAKAFNLSEYDKILFSFHGIPIRQLDKVYSEGICTDRDCTHEIGGDNRFCYLAQCYATTREVVKMLNIPDEKYQVVFQSRLGSEPWTTPFAEEEVIELAKSGAKKILMFSPAFVADCLETEVEIAEEYLELFQEHGGEHVQLVPSLNDSDIFVECLAQLLSQG
jgi:ferrochelatase